MKKFIMRILNKIGANLSFSEKDLLEKTAILTAKQLSISHQNLSTINDLSDIEFQVFSQNGEDGIIDWIISKLPSIPKTFIEFGVENYQESNTRYLLVNRGWKGLVIDGSSDNVSNIKCQKLYWQHNLTAVNSFITAENINSIFHNNGFVGDIGILSIDIDGNDYWVWDAINIVNPAIVIAEYSAVLGDIYPITIPYKDDFYRMDAHYSGQYGGASICTLNDLAEKKGYMLLGTNSSGVNAFFVRNDLYDNLRKLLKNIRIYPSQFSDTRDKQGNLTYLRGDERLSLIKDCRIVNTVTSVNSSIEPVTYFV